MTNCSLVSSNMKKMTSSSRRSQQAKVAVLTGVLLSFLTGCGASIGSPSPGPTLAVSPTPEPTPVPAPTPVPVPTPEPTPVPTPVPVPTPPPLPSPPALPTIKVADYLTATGDQTTNVQHALNDAEINHLPLEFPARTITLTQANVLRLPTDTDIRAIGTIFDVAIPGPAKDGVIFAADNVTQLHWTGGTFIGHRDTWSEGSNISPIAVAGTSHDLTFSQLDIQQFTAPGIRIIGTEATPIQNITLDHVTLTKNSAYYYDYLERPPGGPAGGSEDTDKGQLLLHHVKNFTILDSVIQDSAGDGTYFRWCTSGTIQNVQFLRNKMGGLLLNQSSDVTVQNNVMDSNGSRNVTIEWGSERIRLLDNVIQNAGREGVWGWGWYSGSLEGNTIRQNGQKHDGDLTSDFELGEWSPGGLPQAGQVTVQGNTFGTDATQFASVHIRSQVAGAVVENNDFTGANPRVRADSLLSGVSAVTVQNNRGWWTERSGTLSVPANGSSSFTFAHGLSFSNSDGM